MLSQTLSLPGICLRFLRTGFLAILVAIGLLGFQTTQAADLLIIDKIKCVKPAGGLDAAGLVGLTALTAALTGGAVFSGTAIGAGGATFVTAAEISTAASVGGASAGVFLEARDFLDEEFSGIDDLIVQVNGKQVFPLDRTFFGMDAGHEINPNIRVSFEQGVRVELIEHDSGSDNDLLANIDIRSDEKDLMNPGEDYSIERRVVYSPGDEEGSIYEISYRILRNQGNTDNVTTDLMCGTNQCTECATGICEEQDYSQLDRDGDLEDILSCPFPYEETGFIKFPQFIVDDVYLKKCRIQSCSIDEPSTLSFKIEGEQSRFSWGLTPGDNKLAADKYEIVIIDQDTASLQYKASVFGTEHALRTTFAGSSLTPGDYWFQVRAISSFRAGCKSQWSEKRPFTLPPLNVNLVTTTQSVITTLNGNNARLGSGSIDVSPQPFSRVNGNLYPNGLTVTMTAKPSIRSEFDSWDGSAESCGSNSPICEITVTPDLNPIARFRPKPVLNVIVNNHSLGEVDADIQGDGCSEHSTQCSIYSTGTSVTLNATAKQFSTFSHWEGDCVAASVGNNTSITMTQDKNCKAVFVRTDYQLTVSSTGNTAVTGNNLDEINCGSDCDEVYSVSDGLKTVKLTAEVDPDFVFVRWYGSTDCFDENENDGNPKTASITVGNEDIRCSAISVREGTEFALTVNKTGGAFGTVTAESDTTEDSSDINCAFAACAQRYVVNSVIKLTAIPARGTVFDGWSGHPDCEDGEVSMVQNIGCTANFTAKVLLVDGSNHDNLRSQYTSIFNSVQTTVFNEVQSVDYDEWSVFLPNSTSNPGGRKEPLATDLSPYSSVIWYSGDASSLESVSPLAGPSEEAEAQLAEYLDGGGCLLLSSPQYHLDRGISTFAQKYLGIKSIEDDVTQTKIEGTGALILGFSNLGPFNLNPSNEGLTPGLSDSIGPDPLVTGSATLFNYANGSAAAVATDNDIYRTAYFGFPFLALNSGNTRINTMSAFINYCQSAALNDVLENNNGFDSAIERQGAVGISDLKILPGDEDYFLWEADGYADAKINISFIKERSDLVLEVYDNSQTLIGSGQGEDGNKEIVITNVDIGNTYFVRIKGEINSGSNRYTLNVSSVGILDFDRDGVPDSDDVFPEDPTEQFDLDNDFIGDNVDTDNDNDGMSDEFETLFGFNVMSATDASADADDDGFTNLMEALSDTNPKDPDSVPFVLPIEVDEASAKAVANAQAEADAKAAAEAEAEADAKAAEDTEAKPDDNVTTNESSKSSSGSMDIFALLILLTVMLIARRRTLHLSKIPQLGRL